MMLKIGDVEYPSLKGKVSEEEWQARVELAAMYRLVPMMGWDDQSLTHCSARIGEHYLFNPLGFLFEEITASSLVKVTLDGEIISDTPFEITIGGWYVMKAVHAVREDANFVIHTHDDFGAAVAAQKRGLLPISQPAAFAIGDALAYHDYEGVETYEARMPSLQASLGKANNNLILRNHGLLTLGYFAKHAFLRHHNLRKACRIQVMAGADGCELVEVPTPILETFPVEIMRAASGEGNDAWPGLLRKLERLDPGFKD